MLMESESDLGARAFASANVVSSGREYDSFSSDLHTLVLYLYYTVINCRLRAALLLSQEALSTIATIELAPRACLPTGGPPSAQSWALGLSGRAPRAVAEGTALHLTQCIHVMLRRAVW